MVRFIVALLVVGILVLIFWILEALFEGVLTLWPMDVTGVVALGETLAIPVVALVEALLVVCSTM